MVKRVRQWVAPLIGGLIIVIIAVTGCLTAGADNTWVGVAPPLLGW